MTYKEAEFKLKQMNFRGVQLGSWRSCTYLTRREHYLSIDCNGQELIRLYPNGTIIVKFGQWPSRYTWRSAQGLEKIRTTSVWCERKAINLYFPASMHWWFYSYRHHTMIKRINTTAEMTRNGGWECPNEIKFDKDGNTNKSLFGMPFADLQRKIKHQDYVREKPRRKGRYWQARVRNLYLSKSNCKHNGNMRKGCVRARIFGNNWFAHDLNRPQTFECGCRLYRKQLKFRYTIKRILAEPNSTVRMCMIKLYGIDRFFKESGAREISSRDKYQLYSLSLPKTEQLANRDREIELNMLTALRMVCPSTGDTFVHLVPNHCQTVDHALNWKYDISDYRGMVKSES